MTHHDQPRADDRGAPAGAVDERTLALRSLLVTTVEQTARRRRWRSASVGGALLCVLAGATMGGAITAAATPDADATAARAGARAAVQGTTMPYTPIVGDPEAVLGSGDDEVSVGAPPPGAEQLAWSLRCLSDAGATRVGFAASEAGGSSVPSCDPGRTVTGTIAVGALPSRTVVVRTTPGARWTLSTGWLGAPPLPGPSAAQQEAVRDGVVTRSEYLAAFHRFQGCMTARGESLGIVPESSLFVVFGVSDLSAGDWCGASEFDDVSSTWQSEHPAPPGDDGTWGDQRYDPSTDPRSAD
ncbi:hypothetical protein [Curtobacterium sp. MCBA15_004]|uniref:hypothetical protein n=1 Tax=unclassified Curtobacterium TaxID=257496 RepID=UPI0008DE9258|nr:hypothetical protein [Curtobacterium sp. MCBA15_004]WIA98200.1 hypothetical protein QOL16_07385 [Curtobacterium sp. MCBA15_004]